MRSLKLLLGSVAFLLCFWMTSGLLTQSLFAPDELDCAVVGRETEDRLRTVNSGLVGISLAGTARAACLAGASLPAAETMPPHRDQAVPAG
ncbi:hypothetical protein [Teichococcus vastitatis]|uniref:Uncharacterized protein n=1 Tax=Teichococcus vastitatis TaxID=2307076 RepID=A0ABS9W519_9PROT|nr:hypothetical protein [Pseudoroseomonas vastitatis]MCI0754286.1 hypothetical protein [Pseudoroseomonas vastitatis]